ncbi:Uclacyanin 1 [Mucuna pruriens]|uniref:Uclacyanin 1 n=1 Tax=Mucuna pruriens TaxID=157652 RepID=A0A371FH47_MUCPR|nr:Uclacyanin 1 [Mucuna pruriens]
MGVPEMMFRVSFMAILINLALATNYNVGGPNGGWDTNSNLQSWASSQTFSVGDSLVFQYPPNHNVVEVTKADYDSCQPTNPIQSYNDGTTTIPLTSAGKRYFICGTIGHCSQGMKVEIDTLATATISATPAASPEDSTTSPAESPEDIPTAPSPLFETHLESPTFSPVIPSTEFPASASPLVQHSSDLSASSTTRGNLQAYAATLLLKLLLDHPTKDKLALSNFKSSELFLKKNKTLNYFYTIADSVKKTGQDTFSDLNMAFIEYLGTIGTFC